jgi:ribosomal protein S18 acetylase RimI-like enzyme
MLQTVLADRLEYHEESSNGQAAINIGGEYIERGDVMFVHSRAEFGGGFNFACRIRCDETQIDKLIDDVGAWFAARNVSSSVVRVSPLTRPANLAQILERRGFTCVENETQMVLEADDTEPATNPHVIIEQVQPRDLEYWVGIQHRAFGGTDDPSQAMIEMARKSMASGMTQPYLARLANGRGEIVAAGTLTHWANAYGIYGLATMEQARGQGVATAMVRQMIRDVRASDEPICLQAQTKGAEQHWYERLGFRVVYDRTGWSPSQK